MDAGGRVTQEQLPRDANENGPLAKLKLIKQFMNYIERMYNERGPAGQTVFRAAFLGTFLAVAKSTSPAGANTGNAYKN